MSASTNTNTTAGTSRTTAIGSGTGPGMSASTRAGTSRFNGARFLRLFVNDLQQQWKRIWISTLALCGAGLIAYLTNLEPAGAVKPALYVALFPIALLAGGLLFTSAIFADLHHPLQRFQYLTLPCSNVERFLSRYLLTGPLYYLYVLVVYTAFDWLAAAIANALAGTRAAPFEPFEPRMIQVMFTYFALQALMFGGAIFFRSHALVKTALGLVLIAFGLTALQMLTARVFYWSYFTSLLESAAPVKLLVIPPAVLAAGGFLLYLWVLFIAYQCLREHEAQREL